MKELTIIRSYTDTLLEQEFNAFESTLRLHAEQHGRADALKSMPSSPSEFQVLIGEHIYSQAQHFIHHCASKLQTLAGMTTARQLEQSCSAQTAPLYLQLTNTDISIAGCEAEKKQLQYSRSSGLARGLVHTGLCIMGGAEAAMSFQAFRYAGLPRYAAIIASVSIGIAIILGCLFAARWIKKAKNTNHRAARYTAVTGAFAVGFLELANLRMHAYQLSAQGFNESVPNNACSICAAIAIFVISLLLFCVGLVSAVKVCRSKEQKQTDRAYTQACDNLLKLQESRSNIAKQISAIEQEVAAMGLQSRQKHEYAASLYERAIAAANGARQLYIANNVRSRTGAVPAFFSEIPPMKFSLFPNQQNSAA